MSDTKDWICWVDLETTGLVPATNRILEIGMILTDGHLEQVDNFKAMIHQECYQPQPGASWVDRLEPVVRDMHTKSGLIADIAAGGAMPFLAEAEASALSWLVSHGVHPQSVPVAGSNVNFDRDFLKKHMPALHGWFHYRSIDVSTVKELVRRWYGEEFIPAKKERHRAISDLVESIEELRAYRELVFV